MFNRDFDNHNVMTPLRNGPTPCIRALNIPPQIPRLVMLITCCSFFIILLFIDERAAQLHLKQHTIMNSETSRAFCPPNTHTTTKKTTTAVHDSFTLNTALERETLERVCVFLVGVVAASCAYRNARQCIFRKQKKKDITVRVLCCSSVYFQMNYIWWIQRR